MIGVRAATAQPAGCSDSTSVEGSGRSLPSSRRWPLDCARRALTSTAEDRVMPQSVNVVETLGRYIGTFVIGLTGVDDP
jgi:hypothetical protein